MTARRDISVVITDLDNTLFDWVFMWHRCFSAMLQRLSRDSGIGADVLEREFQAVHERHHTSEYSFAIEELPSLRKKHPHEDLAFVYRDAIEAYRAARRDTLKLYPGVLETLVFLRGRGCLVVGYTESLAFYSAYRVRRLGLDGLLDYLFSPADHDIPAGLSAEQLRFYPAESYEFRHTVHLHTPKGAVKPNPAVLRDILETICAKPGECLYVGDNLHKDVEMAQAIGIVDVHAKYGDAHERSEYELLKRVTHWPQKTVAAEYEATTVAGHVLESRFSELLEVANFKAFEGSIVRTHTKRELPPSVLEAWKTTVEVQQHFNDLELRVRSLAVTIATTTLGAVGYLWTQGQPLAARMVAGAGLVGWIAFWLMDRHWYHRLLLGAVRHGQSIEERYGPEHPELHLAKRIGEQSPWRFGEAIVGVPAKIRKLNDLRFPEGFTLHSSGRLELFYALGVLVLVAALFVVSRWDLKGNPIQEGEARKSAPSASVGTATTTTDIVPTTTQRAASTSTPSPTSTSTPAVTSTSAVPLATTTTTTGGTAPTRGEEVAE